MEVKAAVWLAKSLGVLLVVVGAYFWIESAIESYGDRRAAAVQADWDADVNERRLAYAGQMEVERVKGATHAQELADERAQRAADRAVSDAAAADTRRELLRLRSTTAAVTARLVQALTGAGAGPGAHALATASGDVFEQCQDELVGLGEQAEGLAARLRGLQAWARSAVRLCGADDAKTTPDK